MLTIQCRLFQKFLLKFIVLLSVLLVLISSPVIISFLGPIYLFRYIISQTGPKYFKSYNLAKILSTRSTIYAASDDIYTSPNNTLLITAIVQGTVHIDKLRHDAQEKIINRKDHHTGQFEWPELQQNLSQFCGFLFWTWTRDFDIENHINYYKYKYESSEETVDKIQKTLLKKPFDKGQPLWEVLILKNLSADGNSTVFLRVHHSLCDFMSICQIFLKLIGQNKSILAQPVILNESSSRPHSSIQKFKKWATFYIKGPFEFCEQIYESFDYNIWHWGSKSGTNKFICINSNVLSSSTISLKTLKEIKKIHGVYVTSILMACIAGATRKLMVKMNNCKKLPKSIHCISPLRAPHDDKLRNNFSGCFVKLPIAEPDALKRLAEIQKNLRKIKKSTIPDFIYKLMPIAGGLFIFMIKIGFRNFFATTLLTSLPGPPGEFNISGNKCLELTLASGLLPGNTALLLTALSYNGNIKLCGIGDAGIFSSDERINEFITFMSEEVELLRNYVMQCI